MTIAVGKKIGMTQIENEGSFVGVSVVEILPLIVTQIKKEDKDGYSAIQFGVLDSNKKTKLKKPQIGHLKKISDLGSASLGRDGKEKPNKFREFRIVDDKDDISALKVGEKINFDNFGEGDQVDISGMSIGRGFQGVIKRHHFHRGPKTHGSDHHRAPGSIGMCSFPARVFKGKKLPGRDGVKNVKIKNLRIIKFYKEKSLMLLNGSVPGKKDSYIGIRLASKAKIEA
ncbi:MAG: 50S ribosomal protein L3 [Candidatus Berkelbacteria bacterium]|nr:50S ribosomal protein L3 [Candidatus Berkelbacteria bacterium]